MYNILGWTNVSVHSKKGLPYRKNEGTAFLYLQNIVHAIFCKI